MAAATAAGAESPEGRARRSQSLPPASFEPARRPLRVGRGKGAAEVGPRASEHARDRSQSGAALHAGACALGRAGGVTHTTREELPLLPKSKQNKGGSARRRAPEACAAGAGAGWQARRERAQRPRRADKRRRLPGPAPRPLRLGSSGVSARPAASATRARGPRSLLACRVRPALPLSSGDPAPAIRTASLRCRRRRPPTPTPLSSRPGTELYRPAPLPAASRARTRAGPAPRALPRRSRAGAGAREGARGRRAARGGLELPDCVWRARLVFCRQPRALHVSGSSLP